MSHFLTGKRLNSSSLYRLTFEMNLKRRPMESPGILSYNEVNQTKQKKKIESETKPKRERVRSGNFNKKIEIYKALEISEVVQHA